MKRFLLLFCAVALACSIMIVPALAAESNFIDRIDFKNGYCTSTILLPGHHYYLECFEGDDTLLFSFDMVWPEYLCDKIEFEFHALSLYIIEYNGDLETELIFEDDGDLNGYYLVYELVSDSDPEASPIGSIFDVFGGIGSWIVGQLGTTTSLFWNGQGLTFLGVLSVYALALAVILLLVMVVVRFLRFRS